jgi:hypothetical protein
MKKERGSYVYKHDKDRVHCFFVERLTCCGFVSYFAGILATRLACG